MASKPDLATREAGAEQETEREGKNERRRQREHRQKREQKKRERSWNSSVLRRIVWLWAGETHELEKLRVRKALRRAEDVSMDLEVCNRHV